MKKTVTIIVAALGLCTPLTALLAQPAGYAVITDPLDPNLVEPFGTYVLSEYYCGSYSGSYTINGLVFVNNFARVGGSQYTGGSLDFGASQDATNLALISEGSQYAPNGATMDFTVPTVAGHNYVLELLFHDDDFTAAGKRVFTVYAGPQGSATNVLLANMDLVALGAGEADSADVVVRYVLNNSSGSQLEIKLVPSVQNVLISGLLLLDVTSASVPPLLFVGPTPQSGFAGFDAAFSCVAAGPPGLAYQWQTDAGNPGTFTNLTDGNGVSGSATPTLTLDDLTPAEQANYQIAISDSSGSVTSAPVTLTVTTVAGLSAISGPAGLNTSGNFLVSEYYGFDWGLLPINGLTFNNNNGRLGSGTTVFTANLPNFGATASATNMALISESDLYVPNPGGFDFVLPTVAGRSYSLQLLFHDNFFSTVGSRVFNVSAGLQSSGLSTLVSGLDLVALGAYGTNPLDALLILNITNSDGSGLEINISSDVENPMISALTLQDLSAPPVPPVVNIEPAGTNIFAGRTFTLSTVEGGEPLAYQWQASPTGMNAFTNLTDGGNLSGSASNTLTVTNATVAQSDDYQLVAGNSAGMVTSAPPATVMVYPVVDFVSPASTYPYANAIITNNVVDYWRLNETAGPLVYDSGPGAKDGTTGANLTLNEPGPESPAFPGFEANNDCIQTFADAMNDYITTPPLNFATNTVTLLAWINPTAQQNAGAGLLLSRLGASGTYCSGLTYGITLQAFGDYSLRYFWNGNSADSGLQVPQNLWSLVALVITPTNSTIYVLNGNSIASWSQPATNAICPFSNPFLIGNDTADNGYGTRTFTGFLDEPAVFTEALSFNQVLGLYNIANGITELAPTVTAPAPRTIVYPGASVTLTANGAGVPVPSLQWMKRPFGLSGNYQSVVNGNGVSGAKTATLSLGGLAASSAADYVLVAANNLGTATSSAARVLVIQTANPPALIGEWLTGSQNLIETSGYNAPDVHDGLMVPSGATPAWTTAPPGFSGSALQLNGASAVSVTNSALTDNDYRTDYDHNITNRFSIAFWAQGFPASGKPFVSKYGNTSAGWQVERDSNNGGLPLPTLQIPGINSAAQQNSGSGIAVNDSNWHHYCATYDAVSGQEHFYLDGVCVDFFDNDYPYVAVATAEHLVLGAGEQTSLGNYFTGNLFDVRLYNYAVQPAEVQAMIAPPAAGAVGLYLGSTNNLVVGFSVGFTVTIPAGANASGPVTVTVTNNAPGVAVIEGASGNPFSVTFAEGGAVAQDFTLQAVGPGAISFTAGANGLLPGSLSDMVAVTVVMPTMIGHWITGGQTLQDQSGYNPGNQDGQASAGTSIGGSTAVFNTDVPPAYTNLGLYCLTNNGTYAVTIEGTSQRGSGNYFPTFDEAINNGFSFAFWAKGWPSGANPWLSKNGNTANDPGWQLHPETGVGAPSFVVRYAAGAQDNKENCDMYNSITVTNAPNFLGSWHHYACTWDGIAGLRKLYVDGVLSATMVNDQGPIPGAVDSYLVIGGYDSANVDNSTAPTIGSYFTGEMFDVRMYNYPLAFSEVQSLRAVSATNLQVAADTPVIDVGQQGMVSITLPLNINTTVTNTIYVTNLNPSVVTINGVSTNVFAITFLTNSYPTERLTLTGVGQGQATIAAGGAGLTPASATVSVYGPQMVGRWFIGASNTWETSGFMPAHTHDGAPVNATAAGDTYQAGGALFSTTVPPGFPGASLALNSSYCIAVSNSDLTPGNLLAGGAPGIDPNYQPTFDDVIAYHFTITFWEQAAQSQTGSFQDFFSKGGDDDMGFQLRRNNGTGDDYNMHYSGSHVPDITDATTGLFLGPTWVHVAAVFDGYNGYRALYTNGVLEMVQTNDYGSWAQARNHHLCFGGEEQPVNNGFATFAIEVPVDDDNTRLTGNIYDMRIYNYAMTQPEIASLQTYVAPTLEAQYLPGGRIQIAWSNLYPSPLYQLYTAPALSGPVTWSPAGLTATLQNGQYVATDTAGSGAKFYKLVFVPQ